MIIFASGDILRALAAAVAPAATPPTMTILSVFIVYFMKCGAKV